MVVSVVDQLFPSKMGVAISNLKVPGNIQGIYESHRVVKALCKNRNMLKQVIFFKIDRMVSQSDKAPRIFQILLQGLLFIKITTSDVTPVIGRYDCEKIFKDPANGEKHKFPFLDDNSSVLLSVVVPSYNEESRCKCLFNI